MIVPVSLTRVARRLLLVPVLVAALFVVLVDAPASPPGDRGNAAAQPAPGGGHLTHKPVFAGDARRMR